MNFKYIPERYDDDPEVYKRAPPAFEVQKEEEKFPVRNNILKRKVTIKTGFRYIPDRYDDDPKVYKNAESAFDKKK